jgi:C-terminal processing protease CtpA/Prc
MKSFKPILFSALVLIIVLSFGCKKDNDSTNVNYEIKDFIWHGLNEAYLWVDKVPKLNSNTYATQSSVDKLINTYDDPEKLFYDLLYQYGTVDKWSWIVDDYTVLENYFQGITKSMGFEFDLARISGTDNIFGIVLYTVKGGPADKAGLKRGDIFIKINNTQLTVNNYQDLLYNLESYTMGFATITNNTINPSAKTLNMVAEEVHENPIYLDTVYTINSKKIGYLVYNGFMSDYDIQLNSVFSKYKTAGLDKMIIDLRYNGGGSVTTATYMASMIYGTYTDKVLLTTRYNSAIHAYLSEKYGADFFRTYFTNTIAPDGPKPSIPINTINLTDIYIITTSSTASASELIINGLKPYMNVVTIGTNTHGKYVGSITIKDETNGVVNSHHKWAMQPIVVKIANKDGVSDFVDGLPPTVSVSENIANLKAFGDTSEIMLKTAINYINGISTSANANNLKSSKFMPLINSKEIRPFGQDMYIDPKPGLFKRF